MLALVSPINQGKPTMTKSKGFVLQHQSIDDQPWSNDPYCMLVAQFLIRKCSYKPHAISYGKHDIDLGIGEFVTTSLKLSKMCAVYGLYISSKNPDEAAKSAIKRVFKILEDDGFLSTRVIGKGKDQCTVISLKNWSKYQSKNVSVLKPITEPLEKPLEKPLESHTQQVLEGNSKPIENPNLKPKANPNNNKGSKQQDKDIKDMSAPIGTNQQHDLKKSTTPYSKIHELYQKILVETGESNPRLIDVLVLDKERKARIKSFWMLLSMDMTKVEKYFQWLWDNRDSHSWLFGSNAKGWMADIEYLCREKTVRKARENNLSNWEQGA